MNEHDSEVIAGLLEREGYTRTDDIKSADVIIYNTCCVRENPERKTYGQVGDLKALKRKNPDLIIGICGCMPQQPGEAERIREKLPHVDIVFGTHNIHRLPELLKEARAGRRAFEIWEREEEILEDLPVRRQGKLKAWVTIMYGCNNFCAYCIVPYVRGRERSRKPEDIVREVTQLGREGYKEVTLLGQNVNAYGKGLEPGVDFSDLLLMLNDVPGIERIRYTTSHPRDFSEKLIETVATAEKVCENFHLPLQAGSDKILKRMGRGYTLARYLGLVHDIRARIPGASITTDLIVGFPGETDEDFQRTLEAVEEIEFDSAFTFIYSPRRGTRAAEMPDQVPEDVKHERIQRLIEVQNAISLRKNQALVGTSQEVLVEGPSEGNPDMLEGRTRTNKLVHFPGDRAALEGKLVTVKITSAKTWTLGAEVVK
ncbi:MAG TPA: tRNA (N6-isopentenyl adenosine(37)-C2)-methylthiotransferase MiaB [Firmicutes bacterium]|nr:tRNA (N6-isopentenyl adenosine(37)-C2)-methylthiotransferase MiaB [Bacillota bacterium]